MRELTIAGLTVRLIEPETPAPSKQPSTYGGGRPPKGTDLPLVILLHGFGAPGDDLVGLVRGLPQTARYAFPAAPLSLGWTPFGDSRAWWQIDLHAYEGALLGNRLEELATHVPEGLATARERIENLIDGLQESVGFSSLILGGFSQGAMLSCDVALRSDRALRGLVLLSGTFICAETWTSLAPRRTGLPFFQSHGSHDPLLPISLAEKLNQTLVEAGLQSMWCPFPGAHEIPATVVTELHTFLDRTLAEPSSTDDSLAERPIGE